MFANFARKIFGSANDRMVRSFQGQVQTINGFEGALESLDDAALQAKTAIFQQRFADGETLETLLPESFAVVREASKRVLGMRHFDVQLLGAMALHHGFIAEMKTGEGKTLVATLAVYLNALTGGGVHVVTVNDYLARRDGEWMGRLYEFLGLTVGIVVPGIDDAARQEAYKCDITYGTNNEFGFDYLRDNLKLSPDQMVQRPFQFAIVDEVDSILIDEARTPLIISGPSDTPSERYQMIDQLIPHLKAEDFEKDEKQRSVALSETGQDSIEKLLRSKTSLLGEGGLYDLANVSLVHHINQALRAHHLFQRDVHYIVKDDRIMIIDEFTGRMMEGRRFSDGLHQALEAKEGVSVQNENQTVASITFQNYFRMYPKLAGMTGTAMTEASEFEEIYKLRTLEIPTHMPMIRADHDDEVYRTSDERNEAVLKEIIASHKRDQPVLVGTVSIEKSEEFSRLLKKNKIKHQVLNARNHANEAMIIADAGRAGAVTIATNMAGRGTDIQLGGNLEMRLQKSRDAGKAGAEQDAQIKAEILAEREKILAAGGLYVIGTERHESRRIDNQLRGRSGRQGDPGASKFFLSLDDDLMRIFGSERIEGMLSRLGLREGEAIVHPWVSKALEKAQQKVEGRNFDIRKHLLQYDDVMNDQRKAIFAQRRDLMTSEDSQNLALEMREEVISDMVARAIPEQAMPEDWKIDGLHSDLLNVFGLDLPIREWAGEEGVAEAEILERIESAVRDKMAARAAQFGPELMRQVEKDLLVRVLDHQWKEHLLQLDHLRQGIGLRAYAQRNPLNEYKQEAFTLFETMLATLRINVTRILAHVELRTPEMEA
ncbi:MAG: preprotein translocase subunit SecA, partial [Pseudomonadota bacterium]